MNRMEFLVQQLDNRYDNEDWYPPLADAIGGLTAAQASWRPAGEASNTIWEIASHILYYEQRLLERLTGVAPSGQAANNDETFTMHDETESSWQRTVTAMETVHRKLRQHLASRTDADFDRLVSGSELGTQVTSIIMHAAFHTGQIIQIRKMQGSWPARRSFN